MNTRLQVEHPVTEAIYGVDLVALQIAVAEGRSLSHVTVGEPRGHAIEVRLYAEDPSHNYQPQSGRITRFEVPGVVSQFETLRHGVRLDSGVGSGDEIGTFYDAMIAKVIVWADNRDEALRRLSAALANAEIHGLKTNRDLLVNLLRHPVVAGATMETTWLDGADLAELGASPVDASALALSGYAAAVALAEDARANSVFQSRIPAGFRNVTSQPQTTGFLLGDEDFDVRWYGGRSFTSPDLETTKVISSAPDQVVLETDGVRRAFVVHLDGTNVDVESALGHVALKRRPRFIDPSTQVAVGSLLAPMPGSVISIRAAVGDRVEEGQPLVVMEAMKMQHTIAAPYAGVVSELDVREGSQVDAGAVLAVVTPDEESAE
jgi:propionyl-CoA carboxylase alpha chain